MQAPGADIIGGGFTGGYWAEKTISVYLGSFEVGIESAGRTPSANKSPSNTRTIDMYGSETSYVWIGGSSGAGGGGGGMATPESGEGASSSQNSSKKTYNNTTNKSMRDQNAVNYNTKINLEPQQKMLNRLVADIQKDFHFQNHQLSPENPSIRNYVEFRQQQEQQFFDNYLAPIPGSVNNSLTVSGGIIALTNFSSILSSKFAFSISRAAININYLGVGMNTVLALHAMRQGDYTAAKWYGADATMGFVAGTSIFGFGAATVYFGVQYFYPGNSKYGWVNLGNDLNLYLIRKQYNSRYSDLYRNYPNGTNGFK